VAGEPGRIRLLARPKASVAAAAEARADGAAARLGDLAEAGDALADHDADDAASLAFHADGLVPQLRATTGGERGEELNELAGIDRAAAQLRVHGHVLRDGRGAGQRCDPLGVRVDAQPERVVVAPVAERLDPARRRAGTDGDEEACPAAELDDPLQVGRLRDGAFHEQDVIGSRRASGRGLRKVHDVEMLDDGEQLVLEVEERELAAVARGELDDPDARPVRGTCPC
jgi:hypothetical protein